MRPFSAFFLLFSLLLFAFLIDARRSPGDYWKSIMNNEPMPEEITDLLHRYTTSESDKRSKNRPRRASMASNHYIRNFDVRPNVILYHSDADSKRMKPFGDDKQVKLKP